MIANARECRRRLGPMGGALRAVVSVAGPLLVACVLGLGVAVQAGPPAHAGPPGRSRGAGPPQGAGPGAPAVGLGPPAGVGPDGIDHAAHHGNEDPDDTGTFLPGTTIPRLLAGSLSPAARRTIERRAGDTVAAGRSTIATGLRGLADAAQDDVPALSASLERIREGSRELSKGLAIRRALAEPGPSPASALAWIRDDLALRPVSTDGPERGALGFFHATVMVILTAFAGAMLWMYFFKMRRAAALLSTLQAQKSVPGIRASTQSPRGATWKGELSVAAIFTETATVKTFRLCEAKGGSLPFDYLPGQFLTLKAAPRGKPVQRSYTIASSPTQRDYVEITVKREDKGVVSCFLHDRVKEGDALAVSAPAGRFTFTGQQADAIVLIGGGVGITPMMSVVRYLTDRAWRGTIDLLVCARTQADVIFEHELQALAARHENLHLTLVLSSPSEEWAGRRGRLTKETLLEIVPDVVKRRAHVCGPPKMMDAVSAMLLELGLTKDLLFTERFGPAKRTANEPAGEAAGVSPEVTSTKGLPKVSFRASGKKAAMSPDLTILEAAESVGVEIENSCRVGTCGSCMVRLLEGEVSMAVEDGLHPDDKADGFILACQACAKADVAVDA